MVCLLNLFVSLWCQLSCSSSFWIPCEVEVIPKPWIASLVPRILHRWYCSFIFHHIWTFTVTSHSINSEVKYTHGAKVMTARYFYCKALFLPRQSASNLRNCVADGPRQTFTQWFQYLLKCLAYIIIPPGLLNGDFPTILFHWHSEPTSFSKAKFSFVSWDCYVVLKYSFFW